MNNNKTFRTSTSCVSSRGMNNKQTVVSSRGMNNIRASRGIVKRQANPLLSASHGIVKRQANPPTPLAGLSWQSETTDMKYETVNNPRPPLP
jgi:hypothetical protein